MNTPLKPLCKWSGGKRDEIKLFREYYPKNYKTFVEPFAGGAAVFFDLNFSGNNVINDVHTKRFDVMEFQTKYPDIDIQKKNPTLLYLPDSLENQEMEHLKDGNYIGGLTMPSESNDWWDF